MHTYNALIIMIIFNEYLTFSIYLIFGVLKCRQKALNYNEFERYKE